MCMVVVFFFFFKEKVEKPYFEGWETLQQPHLYRVVISNLLTFNYFYLFQGLVILNKDKTLVLRFTKAFDIFQR